MTKFRMMEEFFLFFFLMLYYRSVEKANDEENASQKKKNNELRVCNIVSLQMQRISYTMETNPPMPHVSLIDRHSAC